MNKEPAQRKKKNAPSQTNLAETRIDSTEEQGSFSDYFVLDEDDANALRDNTPMVEDTRNLKEKFYDKLSLSVKQLDIILAICVIGIILALVFGILAGG